MPSSKPIRPLDSAPERRRANPRPRRAFSFGAVGLGLALAMIGCASKGASGSLLVVKPNLEARSGGPVAFDFQTLDGRPLSTESLSGRVSVIGFITTYDVASQAQARFLAALAKHHTPRINVALLVLEAPDNRPLVEAFVAALHLTIPVAMADAQTIAGEGPFTGLNVVPSVVLLDRRGAEAFRNVGLIEEQDLDEAVKKLESGERNP